MIVSQFERGVIPGVEKNMRSGRSPFRLTLVLIAVDILLMFEVEYSVSLLRIAESSEELLLQ